MKINNSKGFNLLMLCVVILALAILMSSVLGFYSITNYKRRLQTTNERFQAIDLAIKNYIFKEHRFPCPAPLNCNTGGCKTSGDNLGVSRTNNDESCKLSGSNPGVFESENSDNHKKIYYGGVPAITLGLDNSHIVDGWGNKIVYIIPKELTEKGSDKIFYYAKNHKDVSKIKVDDEEIQLDKKYIKSSKDGVKIEDGIVYLLISFNVNRQGAYGYKNKRANYFSGSKNYPIANFEVDTSVNGLLFFKRNIDSFSVGKIEEQIQVCPEITITYLEQDFTFKSAEYGELRFSNELCPYTVNAPVHKSDRYYLSTYRNSQGTLIDNKIAKRCGKNGKWESGLVFKCEELPKCTENPANIFNDSSVEWKNIEYLYTGDGNGVVNMGEVHDDKTEKYILKCFCNYNTDSDNPENHHYECKWYEI